MTREKVLKCRECGRDFLFTPEEQDFYAHRGYGRPRRCKDCRRAARLKKSGRVYSGICAACGKEARVGFQPTRETLVYCGDCWAQIAAERQALKKSRELRARQEGVASRNGTT